MTRPRSARTWLTSPAILLVGAGIYAVAEGPGGVTFYLTPLAVGVIAAVAGMVGGHRHLMPAGLGIAGWGVAVALVHYDIIPAARTTPAYMIGVGLGVLVTSFIAPRADRGAWTHSAIVAVVVAAIFYFVEFGVPSLGRWPAWAISLVIWAAWEILQPLIRPSPLARTTADSAS